MTVGYDAFIHNGLGHVVGKSVVVFYEDDGIIGYQDLEWLHGALNVLIGLFRRIGLMDNVAKSKMMMCQTGTIRLEMLEGAMRQQIIGKGDTYK